MSDIHASPYPGLRPFRMDEDYLFFGREEQTAELVKLLREHRFLAVVGRSGSGKSSLVRAGLLPSIQGGMMQHASSAWEIAVLRPGGHPIRNLAKCLLEADLYDPEDQEALPRLLATLHHSALGLAQAYRQSEIEDDANLLIVVDQFEELFRFERNDVNAKDEAHAFVELLLEASRVPEVPIYVILTMRSDYLGDCAQVPGLAEAVNRGEYLIPRLERGQLRVAIEGPAKVGGGMVSYRLVQHLLNELGDEEDQLPVLQHALMRTWSFWQDDHHDGEEIDLRHYESSGGMRLAISNHADEIFDQLPDDEHREVAQRIFRTLTVKGDDNRGVRRPTRLEQLALIAQKDPDVVRTVIDAYRKPGVTFLMPGVEIDLKDDTVIDLSHESLMRVWQRLRRWVDTEAQSARIYKRLVDTADLHAETKAGLYHNPDLEIAHAWREDENPHQAWADQYGGGFDRAIAFLDASEQEARRAAEEAEKARQRELEQARALAESRARSAALLKRFSVAVGVTCMIAIGLAIWASQQSKSAQANAARARKETARANLAEQEARAAAEEARKAELAAKNAKAEAEKAAAEAIAAEARAKQAQGKTWIANAKALADGKDRFSARLKASRALGFRGHGRNTLETEVQDQFPVLLEPESDDWARAEGLIQSGLTSQLLWTSGLKPQHSGNVVDVAQHPDGSILASVARGGSIHLWDTKTGCEIEKFETRIVPSEMAPAPVTAIEFSPDGKYFIAASDQIEVFTVDGQGEFTSVKGDLPQLRRSISSISFSADGERLALADDEGGLYLWQDWHGNLNRPEPLLTVDKVRESGRINQIAFHPRDHRMLAIAANKRCLVLLIDEDRSREIEAPTLQPVEAHGSGQRFHSLAFSPDGRRLAVAGERVPVTIWNLTDRKIIEDEETRQLAWNVSDWKPETRLLDDEWELLTSLEGKASNSLRFVGLSLAFSPDGSRLAVSWYDQGAGSDFQCYPKTATVFDVSGGAERPPRIADIPSDDGPFTNVFFGKDGGTLYLSRVGRLLAWDLNNRRPMHGEPAAHSARIESLAFSHDGFRFASADHYGVIRVWDARTGDLSQTCKKHWGPIKGLRFSADGSRLFSTGERDRLLCVWDVPSGELIDFIENDKPIVDLDLTQDGNTLLVGGWYNKLFAFDPQTFTLQREIKTARGNTPRILPDGKQLAVFRNSQDSGLVLYELEDDGSATIVNEWAPLHDAFWVDAAFHPDGNLIVVVFEDGTVKTLERRADRSWAESSGNRLPFRETEITQVAFDPQGRRVITATRSGQTKLWDYASGELLEVLPGTLAITALAWSPNGDLLLTGNLAGMIHLWSIPPIEQDQLQSIVVGTQDAPHWILKGSRMIALARRRRLLFSTGTSERLNEIIAWEINGRRLTRGYSLHDLAAQPGALAISPDERYLVSAPAYSEGNLMLWDLETGESRQLDRIRPLTALAFSPDGRTVAGSITGGSPDAPQRISIWDVTVGGPPVAETAYLPAPVMGLAFTNDGQQLISTAAREGHPVQFWDVDPQTRAMSLSLELPSPPHTPMKLTLSHDGTRLAVAFSGGQGRIWDLPASSGTKPAMIKHGALFCAAFSPDDRLLATGGFFDFLNVLKTDSMDELLQSDGTRRMQDVVTDLVFDADGQTLFVSRSDGSITPAKIEGAGEIIPSTEYLRLFDMEEASGGLAWNDRNVRLSPPVRNLSFAPLSDHYMSEVRTETDRLKQRIRLFEVYLSEAKFLAAEGLLFSLDADVATGSRERLSNRLADHLIALDSGDTRPESELALARRLLDDFPDSFGLRLALHTQHDQWKEAGKLVRCDSQSLSVADKHKYIRHFLQGLDSQVSSLLENAESLDENAMHVPSSNWLLASTLSQVSMALDGFMNVDRLRGFSAEIEKPAAEMLLDRIASTSWKTEPFLNEVLAMLREVDPGEMVFPWLKALEEDLKPDASEAPRLWRLRARILEHLGLYDQALAAAQVRLDALTTDNSPAGIRESKSWLLWKEELLRKIEAPAAEIDAVVEQFKRIPVRPPGLDPKMIDLTDYYAQNLFDKSLELGRLPETFTPRHGVDFDLRGSFQLASKGGYKDHLPEKVEGIPIGQQSKAVHLLMGSMNGDELDHIKVAKIIVHFEDGTTSTMSLINKEHIADWFQWFNHYRLTPQQMGWSGKTDNPWGAGTITVALCEVVWKNPHPEKAISHLDIVSQKTKSAPFVVAITLE